MSNPCRVFATWALLGLMTCATAYAQGTFASIDGETISTDEFERFVYAESRRTFYHGSPLDEQGVIEFRRAAANDFIDRKLKIREAKRRGLTANKDAIDQQLAEYEARYGETERWQNEGDAIRDGLRAWLEDQILLEQIDAALREVPAPDADELRQFYDENRDKFTQPEQLHVSVILLRVPPSSGQDAWDQAVAAAEAVAARILDGADFAAEAREHSDDVTAPHGGDMGFVHKGTLGPDLQAALDTLEPGQSTSEPIRVLEGVVLARLEERRPQALVPLAEIRDRALSLFQREASDRAYAAAVAELRNASDIQIDESVLEVTGH